MKRCPQCGRSGGRWLRFLGGDTTPMSRVIGGLMTVAGAWLFAWAAGMAARGMVFLALLGSIVVLCLGISLVIEPRGKHDDNTRHKRR